INRLPSLDSPRMATNTHPGFTRRESYSTLLTSGSPLCARTSAPSSTCWKVIAQNYMVRALRARLRNSQPETTARERKKLPMVDGWWPIEKSEACAEASNPQSALENQPWIREHTPDGATVLKPNPVVIPNLVVTKGTFPISRFSATLLPCPPGPAPPNFVAASAKCSKISASAISSACCASPNLTSAFAKTALCTANPAATPATIKSQTDTTAENERKGSGSV